MTGWQSAGATSGKLFASSPAVSYLLSASTMTGSGSANTPGKSNSPANSIGNANRSTGGENCASTPNLFPRESMRYQPNLTQPDGVETMQRKWRPDAINGQPLITKAGRNFVRPQQRRQQMTLGITKASALRKHFRCLTSEFRTTEIHAVLNLVSDPLETLSSNSYCVTLAAREIICQRANIGMIPINDVLSKRENRRYFIIRASVFVYYLNSITSSAATTRGNTPAELPDRALRTGRPYCGPALVLRLPRTEPKNVGRFSYFTQRTDSAFSPASSVARAIAASMKPI